MTHLQKRHRDTQEIDSVAYEQITQFLRSIQLRIPYYLNAMSVPVE